ncbi:MAG: response regulator [Pseudomonadota bacterium]
MHSAETWDVSDQPLPKAAAPEESFESVTKVLLVHSSSVWAEEVSTLLRTADPGYRVYHAETATAAVSIACSWTVDCAIVQRTLPDMDGLSLMGLLCSTERLRRTPVILVGTVDSAASAREALKAGASDYLLEPALSQQSLIGSIRAAVERDRWTEMNEQLQTDSDTRRLLLERSNRQYRELHDRLGHSVLTPLASIHEFVSLVLDGLAGDCTESQRKYLAYARGSCEQLRLAVIDETGLVMESEPKQAMRSRVRVGDLVRQVLNRFEPEARMRNIFLESTVEEPRLEILVDHFQVQLALARALSRAMKLSSNGSTIIVTTARPKGFDCIEFEVRATLGVFQQFASEDELSRVARPMEQFQLQQGDFLIDGELGDQLALKFQVPYNQPGGSA